MDNVDPTKPKENTMAPQASPPPQPATGPVPVAATPEYSAKAVPSVQPIKPMDPGNMPHVVHHDLQETGTAENPKKSFPKKIILIVLIVLLLLVVCGFGAYYFMSQRADQTKVSNIPVIPTQKLQKATPTPTPTVTPDATASWPMYTNTKIGFSIKYPPRYSTIEIQSSGASPSGKEDNTAIEFTAPNTDGFHSMFLGILPFTGTVDNLVSQNKTPLNATADACLPKTQLQSLTVGDNPALWYVTSSATYPNCENKIYFIEENHGFYFVTGADMDKNEIGQVLSTFTFTNETSSSSAAQQK